MLTWRRLPARRASAASLDADAEPGVRRRLARCAAAATIGIAWSIGIAKPRPIEPDWPPLALPRRSRSRS